MHKPLFDPQKGKMRVAGLISGSGKSLLSIIDKQKQLETVGDCNFEVVGLFSDNPNSKAEFIGNSCDLPFLINDIKKYYKKKGKKINNLEVRSEYDQQTIEFLKTVKPDVVVYAGYVWGTTEKLVNEFMGINGHPADLRVERNGRRAYAGANGIKDALLAGESELHSTLHLVSPKIDHGRILMISEPVPVTNQQDMQFEQKFRYYLMRLNEKLREIFAIVIDDMSRGKFTQDNEGNLYYNQVPIPNGCQL